MTAATVSRDITAACADFLYREAEYLDHREFERWLDCLSEDLVYRMPIRVTRGPEARSLEFSPTGFHMKDTYASMKMRVSRLATEHAYAEDPPSRTQRLITNVRVDALDAADKYDVRSNFLCFRAQGDGVESDLIVGERFDILHDTAAGFRLAARTVRLAHTTLITPNLGVFL
ncbi:3-phenylpropionate/cinnamic acid dioxygenase, small subunit [Nocardia farcinica]|uniref:Biphenyl dioxygenase subunit beta n=1 Tax=Nocardia farcinica TaxID=37329 RepID=A0A0H5NUN7_NOCFR|nr:3-phenylpropionate/cinnamic acid dioxygenase subunit beta [Nocardia farcinica]AXK88888.1 biphenyl 2,3-dioxygenase [Nocardia farcinica]PFX03979.1 Biphenyl dioxygenase subunit beta [Nocardia farcinica]PFX10137.1 Biphenyl dioxygenase subunit beta [Nocardia farcinica]CRY73741.1 Biphenyl dioxygenase subunit beta [Nocardia farcinica]SIT24650.1 3-phenylpropionate/cinnamic acid dioxygenase, small subunit [Nocardia farcinica]